MTATLAGITETPPDQGRSLHAGRRRSQRIFRWAIVTLVLLFFAVPILSLLDSSSRLRGGGRDWSAWDPILQIATSSDPSSGLIREGLLNSLLLVVATLVLMLLLLIPTMIWIRLRVPYLRRAMEFICLLPLTIPAIVLVVGLGPVYRRVADVLGTGSVWLCFIYAILVLPFAYRALDAGLDSIEVRTLSEAARSLGASWGTVMFRIVLPNIRTAVVSASFISLALVLGEYTVASLLARRNLQTAIFLVGQNNVKTASALALVALALGFVLLFLLSLVSSRTSRKATP
ncbi:ABC transporter permease [Nakamurella deserti]|uniref:ABC transporter permease n=1 Tax=Nakamurella deserti TaxID=2164074 RepID=UPI000DBE593F|nr:ABC transporter permease subunit [Nakamurella deserti]